MDSLQLMLLILVLVAGTTAVLMLRRRILAVMARRNLVRRKSHSAILVAGLMIATAMISSALVMSDTLDYIIRQDVYDRYGFVDETVIVYDPAGEDIFFDQSVAYQLASDLDSKALQHIDGVAPAIRDIVPVVNPARNLSAPIATIFAYNPFRTVNQLVDETGNNIGISDVSNGMVVINKDLADELEATVGDTLLMFNKTGVPKTLEVSHVAPESGMATWNFESILFVDIGYAQREIFGMPDMINRIDISNNGGVESGHLETDLAVEELKDRLDPSYTYEFETVKKDGIETAQTVADTVGQLFIIMSAFAIIAGIALVVNIFVMLAEERKPEMGISRAIGMQRGDLTQAFMFEGLVYASIASVIGAFSGMFISAIMFVLFAKVGTIGGETTFALHFQWESIIIAASAGFLLTAITVFASSWHVSRLNIVNAVRNIPEPIISKMGRRHLIAGGLLLAFGLLLTLQGASTAQSLGTTAGPCTLALGLAMCSLRLLKPRISFTVVGVFILFWVLDPLELQPAIFGETTGGIEMFVVTGVFLVAGGVEIAIFNTDLFLNGLLMIFGRKKSLLPVLKTAISYPMNKRFRTGLTLFIFALVMFTVTVMSMIASFQRESVEATTASLAGGFEVFGTSMVTIPKAEIDLGIESVNEQLGGNYIERIETGTTASISVMTDDLDEPARYTLIGYNESFLETGAFSLQAKADKYASDIDAWTALFEEDDLVIVDGSVVSNPYGPSFGLFTMDVGDEITLIMRDGTSLNVTVAGITDQYFLQGIYSSTRFISDHSPTSSTNMFYVSTLATETVTDQDIANALESNFVNYGMSTMVIRDTVEEILSIVSSTMQLMEIFLGIGLIVGIAGLGIITIRNVAERRQEIGVMRAIGYQRRMILGTFLIETSYVALLGILIGVMLGLALSVNIFDFGGFSETSKFVVPWNEIAMIVVVALGFTIASTYPPSRRASRLTPAEALRRVD